MPTKLEQILAAIRLLEKAPVQRALGCIFRNSVVPDPIEIRPELVETEPVTAEAVSSEASW